MEALFWACSLRAARRGRRRLTWIRSAVIWPKTKTVANDKILLIAFYDKGTIVANTLGARGPLGYRSRAIDHLAGKGEPRMGVSARGGIDPVIPKRCQCRH
jgi:hypothetical protein